MVNKRKQQSNDSHYTTVVHQNDIHRQLTDFSQFVSAMDDFSFAYADRLSRQSEDQAMVDKDALMLEQKLEKKVQEALAASKKESEQVYQLQVELKKLQNERDRQAQDLQAVDEECYRVSAEIAKYQDEANNEISHCVMAEEEQKMKVPRLQKQISMYAAISGIKWFYETNELLQGQVAIASKETVQNFSLDPFEQSKFEIANRLWDLMEGN